MIYLSLRSLHLGASGGLVDFFEDLLLVLDGAGEDLAVGERAGAGIALRFSRRCPGLTIQEWTPDILESAREENAWLVKARPSHVLYPFPFYHNLYSPHSQVSRRAWQAWTKTIVCIPDCQHIVFPEFFSSTERRDRDALFAEALERASGVFTVSQFSAESIVKYFSITEDLPTVVTPPRAPAEDCGSAESVNPPYACYPANDWRHKNHEVLLACWRQLQAEGRNIPLILTGARGRGEVPISERISEAALTETVSDRGYLPRIDFENWLHGARILVFPSLFEGFGIPVLDAMVRGVPVVCSRIPAFIEIAGDAAVYFDPVDPKEMARQVAMVWSDAEKRQRMVSLGKLRAADFSVVKTRNQLQHLLSKDQVAKGSPSFFVSRNSNGISWAKTSPCREASARPLPGHTNWVGWCPHGQRLDAAAMKAIEDATGRWPGTDLFLANTKIDEMGMLEEQRNRWRSKLAHDSPRFLWHPGVAAVWSVNALQRLGYEHEKSDIGALARFAKRLEDHDGVIRVLGSSVVKPHFSRTETLSPRQWRREWRRAVRIYWDCSADQASEEWQDRVSRWMVWALFLNREPNPQLEARVLTHLKSWMSRPCFSQVGRLVWSWLLPALLVRGQKEKALTPSSIENVSSS